MRDPYRYSSFSRWCITAWRSPSGRGVVGWTLATPVAPPVGPARWFDPVRLPLAPPDGQIVMFAICPLALAPLALCALAPLALCASALRRYDRPRSSPRWFPAPLRLAVAAPHRVGWACPPARGVCRPAPGRLGLSSCPRGLPSHPRSVGPVLPVSGFACPTPGRLGLSSRSPGLPLSPCRLHALGLARHFRPPSAHSPGPIAWCAALRA